ncbi:MTH1187 family thiamine-binding protein [Desulfuribacillus alkaliarsenatis]|uniref:Thiamine-binding protein domain-containing protein n=1 Tax=Desulfuribacillus alkaliarsenatis TaxID=766136 RepID=A0A1E5G148_9FIRM|nr:MTH1187 family thiamine-binding protein [Desulfuribacillus alkaliarsenatis]OEF96554.1 hypothetical protein BHF68_07860 [Desulfuribacillus alkaliarsenatis]
MAIAEISIVPIGTGTTSVSHYVAEVHKMLKQFENEGTIRYQLTPMSTILEGELEQIFKVLQQLHEIPFEKGANRVLTTLKIDDRRDRKQKMEDKVKSVEVKL